MTKMNKRRLIGSLLILLIFTQLNYWCFNDVHYDSGTQSFGMVGMIVLEIILTVCVFCSSIGE